MKKLCKRVLTMLLTAAMVFGLSGMTAFAAETDEEGIATLSNEEGIATLSDEEETAAVPEEETAALAGGEETTPVPDEEETGTVSDEEIAAVSDGETAAGSDVEETATASNEAGIVTLSDDDETATASDEAGIATISDDDETATIPDTEEYNVKYAVCLWGISQDVDASGYDLGLSFGPATGANYTHDYEAHLTKEQYEADDEAFCIHWMSWEEIATQSRIDPEVFNDCLEYGCTKSVNLMLNEYLLDTSYAGQMDDGDGAGMLRYSIQNTRRYWNCNRTTTWAYAGSQVRGVLVGQDELSKADNTYMLKEDTCLYSCFPQELQDTIVAKEVQSYSNYRMQEEDAQVFYDKIWLLSGKEIYEKTDTVYGQVVHSLEGVRYQRSVLLGIIPDYPGMEVLENYTESGDKYGWWTRSMTQEDNTQVYVVLSNGIPTVYDTISTYGLSPGFCMAGPADKTELIAAIAAAEALDENDYTPGSWAVLANALDEAYRILDKRDATQKEVDDAVLALEEAMEALDVVPDKTELEAAIAEVEEAMNGLDRDVYTNASWQILEDAVATAKDLLADENATQAQCNAAVEDMFAALDGLVYVSDKSALEEAIETAQALDPYDYTEETRAEFEDALDAALAVEEEHDATAEQIKDATDRLVAAIVNLERLDGQTPEADKTALLDKYQEAQALSESDYAAAGWAVLQSAVADARTVLLDQDATQGEVDDALSTLESALDALVRLADKTKLQKEYDDDSELNEEDYTTSSWAALQAALAAAEEVLAEDEVAQEVVDEAYQTLYGAWADLVPAADKSALQSAIEAAEALDEGSYTTSSWASLEAALTAAIAVDADGDASQEDVDAALIDLAGAVASLLPASVDKSGLLAMYEEAMGLDEMEYSTASWDRLAYDLDYALELLLDPDANQSEIDIWVDELEDAIYMLEAASLKSFAVYSAKDDSLSFYTALEPAVPKEGSTYHRKLVTTVYTDVENLNPTSAAGIPWYDLGESITSVEVDESFNEIDPLNLSYWFDGFENATFDGLEYINTRRNRGLYYTFHDCTSVTSLDLTDWGTSYLNSMYGMCRGCTNLTSIDVSGWDTSECLNMSTAFFDCSSLTEVKGLTSWDTYKCVTLLGMFENCTALTEVDLTGWDTSQVTTLSSLFYGCESLTDIEGLAEWDTSAVTNLYSVFYDCQSLTSVDVANWNTAKVTNMANTFRKCTSLIGLDISGWDTRAVTTWSYFATGCDALEWVKIGANTTIFTLGQCVSQRNWYDSPSDGMRISSDYLQDVTRAGTYWTHTTGAAEAFAVYSEKDDSLTFYYDDVPSEGVTYKGKVATTVYEGVDGLAATGTAGIPWYGIRESIASVVIDETFTQVQPVSLAYWFDGCENAAFTGLEDLDTAKVTNLRSAFSFCYGLTEVDVSGWDTSRVTNMNNLFYDCPNVTDIEGLSAWDTAANTDMHGMFYNCKSLTEINGISSWDTENVTTMQYLFAGCSSLTDVNIAKWDTANVTDMSYLFYECSALTDLSALSKWDTSASENMYCMFYYCSALTEVGTADWDTQNVTNMGYLFYRCTSLTDVDVSGWDTANVTAMQDLFYRCSSLTEVDVSGWDTACVTNMSQMFRYCTKLTGLDLSGWDTTAVETCTDFAIGCDALEWVAIGANTTIFTMAQNVDWQNWYDSEVNGTLVSSDYLMDVTKAGTYWTHTTGSVREPFAVYSGTDDSLTFYYDTVPAEGDTFRGKEATSVYRDVDRVTANGTSGIPWYGLRESVTSVAVDATFVDVRPTSLAYWFNGFENATFSGLEYIDTEDVTSLRGTFTYCRAMTEADLSGWDTSKVTDMESLFYDCPSLTTPGDLSDWDTSADTTMYGMFYNCQALTDVGDLSGWDTTNVTTMAYMFRDCTSLTSVGALSDWSTRNVTTLQQLFYNCENLTGLDVSKWNTAYVTNMNSTFRNCKSITDLDLSGWNTADVDTYTYFARGCTALESVTIGARTTIFTMGQVVDQQNWYDSPENGTLVSSNYLQDVTEAGTYWTYTTGDVNKSALESEIAAVQKEMSGLDESAYTEDSWAALEAALAAAQSIASDPSASQTEVDAALSALTSAWDGLTKKSDEGSGSGSGTGTTVDKSALEAEITVVQQEMSGLNKDEYTEASWTALEEALAAAEALVKDTSATQIAVDAALRELVDAMDNLTPAAENPDGSGTSSDKSALESEIASVEKDLSSLDKSAYTADSWAALEAACTAAQAVADDPNATQAEVNDALAALTSARNSLKKATSSTGSGGNSGTDIVKLNGVWTYTVNGKADYTYTGFGSNSNGKWYVKNGKVLFDTTDILKDTKGAIGAKGDWYYVIDSKVQTGYTGVSNFRNANGWWYIKSGKVDFSANTVAKNKNGWWYVTGGKVQFGFTGLANYSNANGWWYIKNGKVDFSHNGVDKNKNGWWYVTGGKVQFNYSGLADYKNSHGWWVINKGKVNFSFTGIASNRNGTWYVKNGKVDFSYSGTVTTASGRRYTVRSGKAT